MNKRWSPAVMLGSIYLLAALTTFTNAENLYSIYLPKHVRPGFNISFTISILDYPSAVEVSTVFRSADDTFQVQSTDTVNSGSSKRVSMIGLPINYSGEHSFILNITGVDAVSGVEVFRNSTTGFEYASKSLSIIIQTDKAIYQPGQTVKFRAIVLKPDLRPLRGNVTYSLKDPRGNIVVLEPDVVLSHGVGSGQFSLTKDAVPGNWEVEFEAVGFKEKLSVEVKKYKLPKFKVEVTAPSYIYPGSPGLTIKLKATYTFGKGVQGSGFLEISRGYSNFYWGRGSFYQPRKPMIVRFSEFNGEAETFITKAEVMNELGWDGQSESSISITGSVTEQLTREQFNDTQRVDVKSTNIKVETIYKPSTIKPGLSYTAYIKVTEFDGKPLTEADRLANDLLIDMEYRYPRGEPAPGSNTTVAPYYSYRWEETRLFTIPPSGVITMTTDAPTDTFTSINFRPYTNATMQQRYNQQWEATRALSPSNSYLQITTDESSVVPGNTAQVTIRTTEPVSSFRIMTISRGEILSSQKFMTTNGQSTNSHLYEFPVEYDMIPGVQVLASYVRDDGEIVADFLKLTVTAQLENQVSISSSSTSVDAGDDVSIHVQTSSPGAYVGARAIDQSVLLLKSGNDVTQERIVTDLNKYSVSQDINDIWRWWWWYPIPSGAKDASDVFKKAGVLVLTDALVYQSEPDSFPAWASEILALVRPVDMDVQFGFQSLSRSVPDPRLSPPPSPTVTPTTVKPRSLFPETWLWDHQITGTDGSATFNTTAPDTITSWVLSAFSLSDEHGLGVSEQHKITVFRNFFVNLNLPLKVIRGELIIVQAVVFNYLNTEVQAQLTLSESTDFVLLRPGNNSDAVGFSRMITIPSSGSVSVKFPLRMGTLGEIPITMTAISELASDALTRKVYVQPEGIEQCYSGSVLMQRSDASAPPDVENLNITIPSGIVPGSEKVKLYVYGDILGSTMNNLGSLLRTPTGCGEQNMVGFAPDVFVTLYLHTAGILDSETRAKAYKHFQQGYSNELNYKHRDGSYSAFGSSDASGSTWLTAFVAKCFIHARELRPQLVQADIIDQALTFLVNQQTELGTFTEPGRVSHKAMQGGVTSPITMAAYVLITLKETNYAFKDRSIMTAAESARVYLESQLSSINEDKYALAIVSYALHVSGSPMANQALQALEALATTEGAFKYWHKDDASAAQLSVNWRPPYYSPPTNDIEMTAYALLTYVRRNDINSAVPVMKWLASKRNSLGGYSGTQDTVIAIQALSKVAALMAGQQQAISISASHSAASFSHSYDITEENSVVFNSVNVPAVNGNVMVTAEGVGVAVAQLSVCYNIPNQPYETEPFQCTNTVRKSVANKANVNWCCSLNRGNQHTTGMFLLEVNLPSGYTVDMDKEIPRNPTAKLVELDANGVNVYYDELSPGSTVCANIELLSIGNVGGAKARKVVASDYYLPDKKVERMYRVTDEPVVCDSCSSVDIDVCPVCPDCAGCPAPSFGEWGAWSGCGICDQSQETRRRPCTTPTQGVVAAHLCGPGGEQTRPCVSSIPCDFEMDGLWYTMPPQMSNYRYQPRMCRAPRTFTQVQQDIPGVKISGKEYLECFFNNLISNSGFTISILVKPGSGHSGRPATIIAYGTENQYPVIHLEKVWWKQQLRFRVRAEGYMRETRGINFSAFVPNAWNHVVLVAPPGGGSVKVYINGDSLGRSVTYRGGGSNTQPSPPQFYLGRNIRGNTWRRGYFNGSFSAIIVWKEALTNAQVASLYQTYLPALQSDVTLSVSLLRHFAPVSARGCFKEPFTIADLYNSRSTNRVCMQGSPFIPLLGFPQ